MRCLQGHSIKTDVSAAVAEVCRGFAGERPQLLLFFCDRDSLAAVSDQLHRRYPDSVVAGAATYASLSPAGVSRRGLSAAALSGDFGVCAGLIGEIRKHPNKYMGAVTEAVKQMGPQAGPDNTVCFLLTPAGSNSEELVLDTLADALEESGIPVMGGAASSDVILEGEVSLNGELYHDSSIFVFLHLHKGRLHIALENVFKPMGRSFAVTRADVENRIIYELDGHPAAEVLRRALGVPPEELPAALETHPLGRVKCGALFIDEVRSVNGDGSVSTFCRVFNHTHITLLELRDFRQTLNETIASVRDALPDPDFSLIVNCFRRTGWYLDRGFMPEFIEALSGSLGAFIGLSSFGEQLETYQLSMSMLVLSIKD